MQERLREREERQWMSKNDAHSRAAWQYLCQCERAQAQLERLQLEMNWKCMYAEDELSGLMRLESLREEQNRHEMAIADVESGASRKVWDSLDRQRKTEEARVKQEKEATEALRQQQEEHSKEEAMQKKRQEVAADNSAISKVTLKIVFDVCVLGASPSFCVMCMRL